MAISLVKGQKISLVKENGSQLTSFCVGANWGMITSKSFFGGTKREAVDLDLSAGLYTADKRFKQVVYFNELAVSGIQHSGDDLTGDADGDDGLDNEVIRIDLNAIDEEIDQVVFILNSYDQHDFAMIPFAAIRLYEGMPSQVDSIVATYNVASDAKYSGYTSMILGKLYRRNGVWKFAALGEPTQDSKLQGSLESAIQYL
jgi:tellurium resistance protein TerZ